MSSIYSKPVLYLIFVGVWSFSGPYWVHWGSSECQSEYFLILKFHFKISEKYVLVKNKNLGPFGAIWGHLVGLITFSAKIRAHLV